MHVKNAHLLFCFPILSSHSFHHDGALFFLLAFLFFLAKAESHFSKEFSIENDTRRCRREMARISPGTHLPPWPDESTRLDGKEMKKKLKSQSKEKHKLLVVGALRPMKKWRRKETRKANNEVKTRNMR